MSAGKRSSSGSRISTRRRPVAVIEIFLNIRFIADKMPPRNGWPDSSLKDTDDRMILKVFPGTIFGGPASTALRGFLLAGAVALTACASAPKPAAAPAAPAVVSLDDWLDRAGAAVQAGDAAKAREAWKSAAQQYPVAKQPWLKLSESYFNAGDYGNAVLAAQEALQREPRDRTAASVIAVSGLRLTAGSLPVLRDEKGYAVGSRDEAITLARSLRDALSEPVPAPQSTPPKHLKRPARAAQAPGEIAAAPPIVKPIARPAITATSVAGNPLDKLK